MPEPRPLPRILVLGNARSAHVRKWVSGYAKHGYEVHLLSIRHADISGVSIHSESLGPKNSYSKFWSLLSYIRLLARVGYWKRHLKPALTNAHFTVTHGAVAALWRLRPLIVTAWGTDVIGRRGRLPDWQAAINRWVLRSADCVTITSRFMLDPVRFLAGETKVVRVPFGVDTSVFRPKESERAPRTKSVFAVGFVKHLRAKYGPAVLIRAMARVIDVFPDAHLLMAGEGELLEGLTELARKLGVADNVRFLGRVEHADIPELMQQLDVLVNPSVDPSETFGVVLLEASATALPIIASRVGGTSETVLHGTTGFLVPPGDDKALADALIKLAEKPQLRYQLGRAGREFVTREYEWERCLDLMIDLFRRTIQTEHIA